MHKTIDTLLFGKAVVLVDSLQLTEEASSSTS